MSAKAGIHSGTRRNYLYSRFRGNDKLSHHKKKLFLDIPTALAYICTEKVGAARIAIVKG